MDSVQRAFGMIHWTSGVWLAASATAMGLHALIASRGDHRDLLLSAIVQAALAVALTLSRHRFVAYAMVLLAAVQAVRTAAGAAFLLSAVPSAPGLILSLLVGGAPLLWWAFLGWLAVRAISAAAFLRHHRLGAAHADSTISTFD